MKQNRARTLEERGQATFGFRVEDMTRVPESKWKPPDMSSLPDRLAGEIGVDLETEDRGLASGAGAGWAWKDGGRVAGYSVSADNFRGYFPIGHPEDNVDPEQTRRWLNHVLSDERQTKLYANAMYDISWAANDGVVIRGPTIDIQLVEALLDEHRFEYSLESIARDRVGHGKDETLLRSAAAAYGVDPKAGLHAMPPKYAGPYAEEDAELPRQIWAVQKPLIEAEKLDQVMTLEHALLPMYIDMRRRGVRVDVDYAEKYRDDLAGQVVEMLAEVKRLSGYAVELWEPRSIALMLDAEGISYPRTDKRGDPSITNDVLTRCGYAPARLLAQARERDKLRGTFLEGQVLNQLHDGRVHGQVHPLRSDEGGASTGRLSMSDPNLMFIPKRTEEGKLIRRCFVPEEGEQWGDPDFNQQEMRLLIHFACLQAQIDVKNGRMSPLIASAFEARDRYIADPDLNYHKFVASITALIYDTAKSLNFAIIYGRGVAETAAQLGKTIEETKALFAQHEQKMPFARAMAKRTRDVVQQRGYIKSLMGRRVRFPFFEPADWERRDRRMLPLEAAHAAWPGERLTRARIHKALNSLVQPSAADQAKRAMLAVWEAGLGKHVLFQMHDSLPCSVPDPCITRQIADVMQDAVKLEVPVKVDVKIGKNWGEVA